MFYFLFCFLAFIVTATWFAGLATAAVTEVNKGGSSSIGDAGRGLLWGVSIPLMAFFFFLCSVVVGEVGGIIAVVLGIVIGGIGGLILGFTKEN